MEKYKISMKKINNGYVTEINDWSVTPSFNSVHYDKTDKEVLKRVRLFLKSKKKED